MEKIYHTKSATKNVTPKNRNQTNNAQTPLSKNTVNTPMNRSSQKTLLNKS
jgi:hypothetical protein